MINRRSFITGLKSITLSKNEKIFLKKYRPWGVILFTRNIKSIEQTKKLTDEIRSIFKDIKYPILIDQEGGRINRFKRIISLDNLTSKYYGKLFEKNKKKFEIYYKIYIEKTSSLLKLIGTNLNTVPVLDIIKKGSSNIIGDRAISNKLFTVNKVGDYCIKLFHLNNIGTIIKHIPGHGEAKVDSHKFTPVVKKRLNYLLKNDFAAFKDKKSLFAMTAHIIYQKLDKDNTATHSKAIIKIIRNKIKFKNILISDDLSMKSLKYSLKENTLKSFKAGCNLVMHCNGNLSEMKIVAKNSPIINKFIVKKTSQFYKILS